MNINCIALDMDRTLLNQNGRLSPGNRRALEYAMEKGVHVVIASGRAFATLPEDVAGIPGIDYAITSNGAAVYHVPTEKCIQEYTLSPSAVSKIMELTREEQVSYEAFIRGEAYADISYVQNPTAYGATPQAVAYVQKTRHMERDIRAFIYQHLHELESMDIIVPAPEQKAPLWARLKESVEGIYITSSIRQLLEISDERAGKHSGLRRVMELLGVKREETAAFGDGDNDIEMLELAGCGIAVANASPGCLAAADFVTRSHDEDGVAYGIYEILNR